MFKYTLTHTDHSHQDGTRHPPALAWEAGPLSLELSPDAAPATRASVLLPRAAEVPPHTESPDGSVLLPRPLTATSSPALGLKGVRSPPCLKRLPRPAPLVTQQPCFSRTLTPSCVYLAP